MDLADIASLTYLVKDTNKRINHRKVKWFSVTTNGLA